MIPSDAPLKVIVKYSLLEHGSHSRRDFSNIMLLYGDLDEIAGWYGHQSTLTFRHFLVSAFQFLWQSVLLQSTWG